MCMISIISFAVRQYKDTVPLNTFHLDVINLTEREMIYSGRHGTLLHTLLSAYRKGRKNTNQSIWKCNLWHNVPSEPLDTGSSVKTLVFDSNGYRYLSRSQRRIWVDKAFAGANVVTSGFPATTQNMINNDSEDSDKHWCLYGINAWLKELKDQYMAVVITHSEDSDHLMHQSRQTCASAIYHFLMFSSKAYLVRFHGASLLYRKLSEGDLSLNRSH